MQRLPIETPTAALYGKLIRELALASGRLLEAHAGRASVWCASPTLPANARGGRVGCPVGSRGRLAHSDVPGTGRHHQDRRDRRQDGDEIQPAGETVCRS